MYELPKDEPKNAYEPIEFEYTPGGRVKNYELVMILEDEDNAEKQDILQMLMRYTQKYNIEDWRTSQTGIQNERTHGTAILHQ